MMLRLRPQLAAAALVVLGTLAAQAQSTPGSAPPRSEAPSEVPAPTQAAAGASAILSGNLPASLEDLLSLALGSNPEILEAEAKVRQAQARWNQTRLRVAQEVITAYHERVTLESLLSSRSDELKKATEMVKTGTAPSSDLTLATVAYAEARGRMEQMRAKLRYLAGTGGFAVAHMPPVTPAAGAQPQAAAPVQPRPPTEVRPPIPSRLEPVLSKVISVEFQEVPLSDVVFNIADQAKEGLEFVIDPQMDAKAIPITLKLSKASVKTVLEALVDLYQVGFVVRDYGILLTTRERADFLRAPAIPEDLPLQTDG